MDLNEIVKNACAAKRAEEMKESNQLTLGELILKLEHVSDKSKDVRFEFAWLNPTQFDSYRGYYNELAIGFSEDGKILTVEEFLAMARDCVGATFEGYKGGEYRMGKTTPVWASNYGRTSSTAVVDVIEGEFEVWLKTAPVD